MNNAFFPVDNSVFQTGKSSGISEKNFAALPPILRVILTTDGTVSLLLSQWFQEQIVVEVVNERDMECVDPSDPEAGLQRATEREILLCGQASGRTFLRASSVLYIDNIPENLLRKIRSHPQGIGGALNDTYSEHLRMVTGWGETDEQHVWREYSMVMGGRLLMQIRETFLLALFR